MIFLVEYDRAGERLVRLSPYAHSDIQRASEDRLALEISLLNRGIEHEVVLLQAESEQTLRATHGRYFQSALGMVVENSR